MAHHYHKPETGIGKGLMGRRKEKKRKRTLVLNIVGESIAVRAQSEAGKTQILAFT